MALPEYSPLMEAQPGAPSVPGGAGGPGDSLQQAPLLTVTGPIYSDAETGALIAFYLKSKGFEKTLKAFAEESPEIAEAVKERGDGLPSSAELMNTHFCLVRLHEQQLVDRAPLKSPGFRDARQTPRRRAETPQSPRGGAVRMVNPPSSRLRLENGGGFADPAAPTARANDGGVGAKGGATTGGAAGAGARGDGREAAAAAVKEHHRPVETTGAAQAIANRAASGSV